ncbi:methyltransferase domain-containing protein [Actinomycetospora termitidis]|uniref:Methyltransferase domain-containing protein n=1 Tax=Actinomycetospora termitidis TaxID=3053470 RepID=A0ABT7MD14_9PSEU|nr:methyltransferase domain-containing protein [Actinomycetospora sp. Odt1-22]MDL5158559.1 methyltransferase domain-containing protein [Actinomycetospora sp. Odt1-22]
MTERGADIHRAFHDVERVPSSRPAVEFLRAAETVPAIAAYRSRLRAHLAPAAGETVLDVGCGVGTHAAAIAAERAAAGADGPVVGVDRPRMIEQAGATHGDAVRWLPGAGEALPLDDDSVDAVYAERVLMYVDDPVDVISEIARVRRPGGRVALFELDYASMVLGGDAKIADEVLEVVCGTVGQDRMGRTLGPLLTDAGVLVVDQTPYAMTIPPPVWAQAVRGPVEDAVADGRLDRERVDAWFAELGAPGAYPGSVTGVLVCGT